MAQQYKIGSHKTSVSMKEGRTVVTYHNTDVVSVDPQLRNVVLNSGGFYSNTTKTRMNQASSEFEVGYRVYQKKGIWYVDTKEGVVEFKDGMKFNY